MAATTTTTPTTAPDPPEAAADYRPIKLLGKGSFGQVWLAEHRPTSKLVCLKAIADQGDGGSTDVATLSQLNHINCVRFFGSFRVGATLYICMQYAEGGDMTRHIKEAAEAQQPFSERQVLRWFGQLCLGLQHMHGRRILHRDLKPQNVLLRRGPLGDRLLIGDVGISKALTHTLEQAHTAIGTPQYLAPEVFQSNPYSFSADVWSLGCLLFELANLTPAFSGRSLNDLSLRVCTGRTAPMRAGVSTAMRDAILNTLQVNPARRPSVLALLQSPLIAPHVQEYAAEVLAEEDDGQPFPADHDTDAPARAELRRQLEECGLQVASASASGLVDRAREAEREKRLLGVLARLRRERDERLLRLAGGQGLGARFVEEQQEQEVAGVAATSSNSSTVSTHTDLTRATTRHAGALLAAAAADATHERTPPASPPSSSAAADPAPAASSASEEPPASPPSPLPPSQPPATTTLAERIHASRAFLGQALGELALRRADEVASDAADVEARLASEVFVGGKAKYLGVFLHVRALEEGRGR